MQGPDFDFQTFFVAPGQKAIVTMACKKPLRCFIETFAELHSPR